MAIGPPARGSPDIVASGASRTHPFRRGSLPRHNESLDRGIDDGGRVPATSGAGRPHAPRRGLLRVLTAWEGAAIGIGVAVGAGIFRTPGYVAGYFSSPGKVLFVWGLGTVLVLGDCLVLAELATRIPRAGGWYAYIEQGWGRFPAFVYGWTYMLVVDPASSAALVVALGEFLASLLGWSARAGLAAGVTVTLALFAMSLAGIRLGSRVQDALTYLKLAAIGGVALAALFLSAPASAPAVTLPAVSGLLAIGLALQGVLWTFEGYANTTTMTEESVDPHRSLPRALLLGTAAVGVTYIIVNAAYLHVLGLGGLQASMSPGADLSARIFGGAGRTVFLLIAILAALGSLNGAALSAPRVTYALGRSRLAPEVFTRVTRLGTPDVATLWFAAAWTVYACLGTFESLVSVSVFIGALCNVAVTASLFALRRRETRALGMGVAAAGERTGAAPVPASSDVAKIFRVPFYPVLPLLMLVLWSAFAGAVLYDQGWRVGYGLLATLIAAVAYFFTRRKGPK